MGMLSEGGPLAHMQLGSLSHHIAAVRHALGNMGGPGRLPAHLLFSDRDFDENDYEALLALDENVKSRKGARPCALHSHSVEPRLPFPAALCRWNASPLQRVLAPGYYVCVALHTCPFGASFCAPD